MQEWHVGGNHEADVLAGVAAELPAIPETEAVVTIEIYKDLELLQNRLIHVTKHFFPQRIYNKLYYLDGAL